MVESLGVAQRAVLVAVVEFRCEACACSRFSGKHGGVAEVGDLWAEKLRRCGRDSRSEVGLVMHSFFFSDTKK